MMPTFSDSDAHDARSQHMRVLLFPLTEVKRHCEHREAREESPVGPSFKRLPQENNEDDRVDAIAAVVKELAQRGRGLCAPGLLPVTCIQRLVKEDANNGVEVNVHWQLDCHCCVIRKFPGEG